MATFIARIARFDVPNDWPDLISSVMAGIHDETANSAVVCTSNQSKGPKPE